MTKLSQVRNFVANGIKYSVNVAKADFIYNPKESWKELNVSHNTMQFSVEKYSVNIRCFFSL